ncbi:MAG TPA: hypothetical protein VND21_00975, partial [Planctomycetota bacterium]|nr:hypothetical protein [Planctomycetota bacterium]
MRPRRVATLLLVAALAGAAAWWAAGRTPDVDPGPIASGDGAIDDAPPADAPALAVAPPSLSRRVAAVPDGTDEDRGAAA